MANHQTKIGGVVKTITGGYTKIGGVQKKISYGVTKIGGTTKYINFTKPVNNVHTAQLYNNGTLQFQPNDAVDTTANLVGSYTGWINTGYNGTSKPWHSQKNNVKSVIFTDDITTTNMVNWFHSCYNLTSFNNTNLNTDYLTNMSDTFFNCTNLVVKPWCGENVTNMYYTYGNCYKITEPPVCGNKVTSMVYTYTNCNRMKGQPVCGPAVTSMAGTYFNCQNITGTPVFGPKVTTSVTVAYYCCKNLTGEAVVPPGANNIRGIYAYCHKLTGKASCSENVVNMAIAYDSCSNLTGAFQCGNKVTDMYRAYYNCPKMIGPAVCGPNVKNFYYTYAYDANINTAIINSTNINDIRGCFAGHNSSVRLNIYLSPNTNTWNKMIAGTAAANSITGQAITWTKGNALYYYNSAQNIHLLGQSYIQYQADMAYLNEDTAGYGSLSFWNSTESIGATNYTNFKTNVFIEHSTTSTVPWYSRRNDITSVDFVRPTRPTSMAWWFYGHDKLTTVIINRLDTTVLTNMYSAFYSCDLFTGPAFSGDAVTNFASAYAYCTNMVGSAVCPYNAKTMYHAYRDCRKLNGYAACGGLVTNMAWAYYNCQNLIGTPVIGGSVVDMSYSYYNCRKLGTGVEQTILIPSSVTNMSNAFVNAFQITNNIAFDFRGANSSINLTKCFQGHNNSHWLKLQVPANTGNIITQLKNNATYGISSALTWTQNYIGSNKLTWKWENSTYKIGLYYAPGGQITPST